MNLLIEPRSATDGAKASLRSPYFLGASWQMKKVTAILVVKPLDISVVQHTLLASHVVSSSNLAKERSNQTSGKQH